MNVEQFNFILFSKLSIPPKDTGDFETIKPRFLLPIRLSCINSLPHFILQSDRKLEFSNLIWYYRLPPPFQKRKHITIERGRIS